MFWATDICNTMVVNRVLKFWFCHKYGARCGSLMVSALDSRGSGPGSSPGQGHCVVFLGKTLYSHSASLHPGV